MYLKACLNITNPLKCGKFLNGAYSDQLSKAARITKVALPLIALYNPITSRATQIIGTVLDVKTLYDSPSATTLIKTACSVAGVVIPLLSPPIAGVVMAIKGVIEATDLAKGIYHNLAEEKYLEAFEKLLRIAVIGCALAAAHTGLPGCVFALVLCKTLICLPQGWRAYQKKESFETTVILLIGSIRLYQTQEQARSWFPPLSQDLLTSKVKDKLLALPVPAADKYRQMLPRYRRGLPA